MPKSRNQEQSTYLSMTGDEFKTLIERVTQDGKVNTLPELFQLIGEIPENMTLAEWIQGNTMSRDEVQEIAEQALDNIALTDQDLEEIFYPPEEEEEDISDNVSI